MVPSNFKLVKLYADPLCWEFREKHPEEFKSFGCGPGGVGDYLVPDTMYGLSVRDACRIHDWGYRLGPGCSEEDRHSHDRILLNNCLRIISHHSSNKVLSYLRFMRARTYYNMVRVFGGPAYWEERNKAEEIGYA